MDNDAKQHNKDGDFKKNRNIKKPAAAIISTFKHFCNTIC